MPESPLPESTEILYRRMRTIRSFEEWVVTLVNTGEIAGATHEYTGQEAVAVGVCAQLTSVDAITSTHRGHGHLIAKGASVPAMMAELMGRATGLNRGRGGSMHAADLSLGILGANGIVAAGAPIAAGAAWASRASGSGGVAVTFFGDGGVNQGVLAETMNLASIWKLPMIFACENNGFAVTLRADTAIAGSMVARAQAYDMWAETVDGMDVDAVSRATAAAVARARAGEGPSYLEFGTYRFVGHNTGEKYLGLSYRTDDEIGEWRVRDPLDRTGAQLADGRRAAIDQEVAEALEEAVAFARASPPPDPSDAFAYNYADLTPRAGAR
ncbi:MAG: thiamine pyrophosphate-dependent enzyme [Propionibacteriaceae bacterium]